MERLTQREYEVYTYIIKYREEQGFSPSLRDICKGCYLASTNSASYYIDQLVKKGMISYVPKVSRSIIIVKGAAV